MIKVGFPCISYPYWLASVEWLGFVFKCYLHLLALVLGSTGTPALRNVSGSYVYIFVSSPVRLTYPWLAKLMQQGTCRNHGFVAFTGVTGFGFLVVETMRCREKQITRTLSHPSFCVPQLGIWRRPCNASIAAKVQEWRPSLDRVLILQILYSMISALSPISFMRPTLNCSLKRERIHS